MREEAVLDPAEMARELGRAPETAPVAPAAAPDLDYCSFCWSALPHRAQECPDCGLSIKEMEAARARAAEQDGQWVPPSVELEDDGPTGEVDAGGPEVSSERAAHAAARSRRRSPLPAFAEPLRSHGKLIIQAAAAAVLFFGAAAGGKWLAYATSPASGLDGVNIETKSANTPARVHWSNRIPDLRLELGTEDGRVVASCNGVNTDEVYRVRPGAYRLRVQDRSGKWKAAPQAVLAKPGAPVLVGLDRANLSSYYLWLGKRLAAQGARKQAAQAFDQALKADPVNEEALRLSGATARASR